MRDRKERNEFGLDKENAVDVQKERAKSMLPWVAGAIAFLAASSFVMFALPNMRNNSGTHVPQPYNEAYNDKHPQLRHGLST